MYEETFPAEADLAIATVPEIMAMKRKWRFKVRDMFSKRF
jgi:hypothetical protein